jgi:hypothetical protein
MHIEHIDATGAQGGAAAGTPLTPPYGHFVLSVLFSIISSVVTISQQQAAAAATMATATTTTNTATATDRR